VYGKAKKNGIIKRWGIYTARKTRWWRKVEGERKRLEEKEVAGEKSRKRRNGGGGLTVRSENPRDILATIAGLWGFIVL